MLSKFAKETDKTDDEIIERRLLIDGDGDEDRINKLHKLFLTWCSSNLTDEENKSTADTILAELAIIEHNMTKSYIMNDRINDEIKIEEAELEQKKKQIETSKEQLAELKRLHKEASVIKQQKMEYDIWATKISEYPERKESQRKIQELKASLEINKKKLASLNTHMNSIKNLTHSMYGATNNLIDYIETKNKMCDNRINPQLIETEEKKDDHPQMETEEIEDDHLEIETEDNEGNKLQIETEEKKDLQIEKEEIKGIQIETEEIKGLQIETEKNESDHLQMKTEENEGDKLQIKTNETGDNVTSMKSESEEFNISDPFIDSLLQLLNDSNDSTNPSSPSFAFDPVFSDSSLCHVLDYTAQQSENEEFDDF